MKEKYSVDAIVTILTENEMLSLKVPNLLIKIKEYGIESMHIAITDGSIPNNAEIKDILTKHVYRAVELLKNDKCVIIHCMGGLNRTAMVALCVLQMFGITFDQSQTIVKNARRGAGGNSTQIQFAKDWYQEQTQSKKEI